MQILSYYMGLCSSANTNLSATVPVQNLHISTTVIFKPSQVSAVVGRGCNWCTEGRRPFRKLPLEILRLVLVLIAQEKPLLGFGSPRYSSPLTDELGSRGVGKADCLQELGARAGVRAPAWL